MIMFNGTTHYFNGHFPWLFWHHQRVPSPRSSWRNWQHMCKKWLRHVAQPLGTSSVDGDIMELCLNNNIMICGNVTFSPTGWYNQQLDPGDILNQPKTWITGGGYMINMGEIFEDLSIDTLSIVYYRRKFRSQTFDWCTDAATIFGRVREKRL